MFDLEAFMLVKNMLDATSIVNSNPSSLTFSKLCNVPTQSLIKSLFSAD